MKVYEWDQQLIEMSDDEKGCVITRDGFPSIDLTWGGYLYEITLDRLNTYEKVLGWVVHLSEKVWMTPNRIRVFVRRCEQANGWHRTTAG